MAYSSRNLSTEQLREILESEQFWEDEESAVHEVPDQEDDTTTLLDEVNTLEEIEAFADESDKEDDEAIFSDHNTDSELEVSDSDEEAPTITRNAWYGKDGTKWSKTPVIRGRTASHNLVTVLPGPKGTVRNNPPSTPLQAWSLLLTDDMLGQLVIYTNIKIGTCREKYRKFKRRLHSKKKCRPVFTSDTTLSEMRAFLGLLYLQGIFKSGHEDIRSMWATDGTGRPIFRATMSLARFSFLLSCIRFDDVTTRKERTITNKLAAISEFFDKFVENSKLSYSPGYYLTVDEMLIPFRGRCSFRMFIPSKPAKYGIKVQILTDAKTHYMVNAEIYCGAEIKTAEPKSKLSNPTRVVLRLAQCVEGTKRNITGDNWYSSVELLEALKEKKITYVGTLKKNKRAIPPEFLPHRNRQVGSSIFGFSASNTIVSYVPKKGKGVILLSSMHHSFSINQDTLKPEIIHFYNETKSGVDALDAKCAKYSTSRRTNRWPVAIFHAILNIAGVNSRVIYQFSKDGEEISRYDFIKQLGMQLIDEHVRSRMVNPKVPLKIHNLIADVLQITIPVEKEVTEPVIKSKRKRCGICPAKKDRKTAINCDGCKIPICNQCCKKMCPKCLDK
ncbi:piggyBac transposable element-derived protein 3-like [Sitophilus oryzae]|uniref:PiggyBac transposable element-derived protein 3-like n=1 Tax=Sitophilus oryzae TaxID=7048 RepID=A0A6J2X3H0_SITOR|nr:piggyBac transposable element-derived protein 3-like [Sitophilus oryzae]